MHFKTQDLVVVTAGAHREKQGRVLRVDEENDQIYIQGVNLRYKHIRRSQKNPRGGRVQKEAPIHVSNVMILEWSSPNSSSLAEQIMPLETITNSSSRLGAIMRIFLFAVRWRPAGQSAFHLE